MRLPADSVRGSVVGRLVAAAVLLAVLAWPEAMAAQATVPGAPALEPTRIRFGTMEYTLTLVRGDEEETLGYLRDEIMPIRGTDPVLRRVLSLTRGNSTLIDSTLTDLETLAPHWHKSVQPHREIEYQMDGARVVGIVTPTSGEARAIDTTLADLAFDSSNWDLIVRALPLADGDAAVLSMYDVDANLTRYSLRVVDRQPRGRTDVIHVIIDMGKGREAHAWFDDITRVLLRVETQLGPDVLLRQLLRGQ
jgi:hypothetical protein